MEVTRSQISLQYKEEFFLTDSDPLYTEYFALGHNKFIATEIIQAQQLKDML